MMSIIRFTSCVSLIVSAATCYAVEPHLNTNKALGVTYETLQTVPGTLNLENLALRNTGDLLVTSTASNVLNYVSTDNSTPAVGVAEIPDVTGLLGIAEVQRDIFYVVGSELSGIAATPGSNVVWKVDMRGFCTTPNGTVTHPANVSLAARIPDAQVLNGMARLDDSHVLLADGAAGTIVKLNVRFGRYAVVIEDDSLLPVMGGLGVGVNGIHLQSNKLYYTSLDQGLFGVIPISRRSGRATGPVEIIARGIVAGDDFALSGDGQTAFIANNGEFTLTKVDIAAKSSSIGADSTLLQAASAAIFAPGEKSLYVTGAQSTGGNETVGRVSRVRIS